MTSPCRSASRGFTLIEVIITLSVFLFLVAAVFGIFTATLQSVSGLQDNQGQSDQVGALGAFLKRSFLDLPADGTVTPYRREQADEQVSGLIFNRGDDYLAIDLHPQPNGLKTLQVATYTPEAKEGAAALTNFKRRLLADDPTMVFRPLVRDVKSADWRFKDFNATEWQTTINGGKPVLAEFTFLLASGTQAVTNDFWLPPTQAATLNFAVAVPGVAGAAPATNAPPAVPPVAAPKP